MLEVPDTVVKSKKAFCIYLSLFVKVVFLRHKTFELFIQSTFLTITSAILTGYDR